MNTPNVPEHTERHVYTWGKRSKCFYLVGYCPDTLDYALALYNDAKTHFPWLEMSDVTFGKVRESQCIHGFTYLRFDITGHKIPKGFIKHKGRPDFGI